MARGRMLSKSLSTSEKRARLHAALGPLAEFAQALYPLLVAHADDFGREEGDVFTIKHRIDPASPRTVAEFERALQGLDAVGLIVWYEVEGRRCVQISNFEPHQSGLHKRTISRFPAPPRNAPEFPGSTAPTEQNRTEGKGTEGNRTEDGTEPNGREENAPVNVRGIARLVVAEFADRHYAREVFIAEIERRCLALGFPCNGATVDRALENAMGKALKAVTS